MTTQTNYLDPESFDKFIEAIPKLPVYHSSYAWHAALPPSRMQLLFKVIYYCALRISEALSLEKGDFDLERRILRIKRAKTGRKKGKMRADGTSIVQFVSQETSIPMPLLQELHAQFAMLPDILFDTSRQSAWEYAKKAGKLAELNIFERQESRSIEGVWTHLFRKSYAKMMYLAEANIALIDVKLRHTHKNPNMADSTFTYIKPDINALITWETEHFV